MRQNDGFKASNSIIFFVSDKQHAIALDANPSKQNVKNSLTDGGIKGMKACSMKRAFKMESI
jgi:hypothetical protein